MELPLAGTFQNPFLSPHANIACKQLETLSNYRNHGAKHRRQRNALLRAAHRKRALSEELVENHGHKSDLESLPQVYKICIKEDIAEDHICAPVKDATLVFRELGADDGGITLNGQQIPAADITWSPALKTCAFSTNVADAASPLNGVFHFDTATPMGTLGQGACIVMAELTPVITWFECSVIKAEDAGVDLRDLTYNADSDKWRNATWETGKFSFGYTTVKDTSDPNVTTWRTESYFKDNFTTPGEAFNLDAAAVTASSTLKYTSNMSKDNRLQIIVEKTNSVPYHPPQASAARKTAFNAKTTTVSTVFPVKWIVDIDYLGENLTGVYTTRGGSVYAVQGVSKIDVPAMLFAAAPSEDAKNFVTSTVNVQNVSNFVMANAAVAVSNLDVMSLVSMTPMQPDVQAPSGYTDSVADLAMKDFRDIIEYHMDDDLHTAFMTRSKPILPGPIKAIADDDAENTPTFYKKLQVPLITSMLAAHSDAIPDAKHCNGRRADKLLQSIPASDDVYVKQSSKLYRERYLERFPSLKLFLDEQKNTDFSANIDKLAETLCTDIKTQLEKTKASDSNYDNTLKNALAEVELLRKWATDKKLYWAFMLYYYIRKHQLPTWYTRYTTGSSDNSLAMQIKSLIGVLGILEDHQQDSNGNSFVQAYNKLIMNFQMSGILPLMVDLKSNAMLIDCLLKETLQAYFEKYKNSTDTVLAANAYDAQFLATHDDIRWKLFEPLTKGGSVPGAIGGWNGTVTRWAAELQASDWYQKLGGNGAKYLGMLQLAFTAVVLGVTIWKWDKMTGDERTKAIGTLAAVAAFIGLRIAVGITRFAYFFEDISGVANCFKVIAGFEGVIDKIEGAATKISNSFAAWFARTSLQTESLAKDSFSWIQKVIGRNFSEALGTILGFALGIYTIYSISTDLATQQDPLLKANDALMLVSASLQIIGTVAGWVIASGIVAEGTYLAATLAFCVTWAGPAAILFAVIGLIVYLVWYFSQDHRSPVEQFIQDRGSPLGLYMKNTAIDYYGPIPAKDGNASKLSFGIIAVPLKQLTPAFGMMNDDLWINTDNGLRQTMFDVLYTSGNPVPNDIELRLPDSVVRAASEKPLYGIRTNAYGNSQIFMRLVKDNVVHTRYLSSQDGKTVKFIKLEDEEDTYSGNAISTFWKVTTLEDLSPDKLTTEITIMWQGKYLSMVYDLTTKSPVKYVLADYRTMIADKNLFFSNSWRFWMTEVYPTGVKYQVENWELTTSSKNQQNLVVFPFPCSSGADWSVSPALPSEFEISDKNSGFEGAIRMKKDVTLKTMGKTEYTVTCTYPRMSGISTKITIQIKDVAVAPPVDIGD